MMTYKKFACGLLAIAFLIAAGNIAFWHLFTKAAFYEKDGHGDLGRMASLDLPLPVTKNIDFGGTHETLQHWISTGSQETYDVLVVGDSASAGTGGTWWQDDLQARYGIRSITALRMLRGAQSVDVHQMAKLLLKLGYVDRIHPKYLVLECGERMVGEHFAAKILPPPDWTRRRFEQEYLAYREIHGTEIVPPWTILSTTMGAANRAYVENRWDARLHPERPNRDVGHLRLTIPAFSNPGWEQELLYFAEDLDYVRAPADAARVNDSFNELAAELRAHGVQLVVLVLPDKSDAYYPWIAERQQPENTFFDDITPLAKDYDFVETKPALRRAIASGEQDLYWCDDTHWSWRAQRLVVDALAPHLAP